MKFSRIVEIFSITRSSRNHGRPDEAEPSSSTGTQAGPPASEDLAESPEVTAGEAGTPTGPPPAGDAGAPHAETSAAGAARTPIGPPPAGDAGAHHAETSAAGAARYIDMNLLDALLQRPCNVRLHTAGKEPFNFLCLFITSELGRKRGNQKCLINPAP
ncbi:hypothetical protein OROHE_021694 [Orobanche hederae]